MDLPLIWFLLIAVLWTGYLILEGFDFGVGMLLPFLGRKDNDRRVMINTIGRFHGTSVLRGSRLDHRVDRPDVEGRTNDCRS
jgi:hypothetical protein